MKRIHIIGAGGVAGIGLTRCVKDFYEVTGEDESRWGSLVMEAPQGTSKGADMVIAVPDSAVALSSFRPSQEQLEICQDKAKTAEILGDLAPKTYWIRDTEGAGGKGAQMASEVLPGRNFSVEFVCFQGKILAWFCKERLSYAVKERTSGLENRGSSAVSVCRLSSEVINTASYALGLVCGSLGTVSHGFYGVDLVENAEGNPKVTEINGGRLLTASYSYFRGTGYNLPLVGVRAFLGEEPPLLPDYPEGWGVIRLTDSPPKLIPPAVTKGW